MRRAIRSGRDAARRGPLSKSSAAAPRNEAIPVVAGLETELAALEQLSLDELRLRWRNRWGRLAPALLSRGLLVRLMAFAFRRRRLAIWTEGPFGCSTVWQMKRWPDRVPALP